MSLIICNECGKSISDKAFSCPHCGNPIKGDYFVRPPQIAPVIPAVEEESHGNTDDTDDEYCMKSRLTREKKIIIISLIAILAVLAGLLCFFRSSSNDDVVKLTSEFKSAIKEYNQIDGFSEGLAAVRKGEKWGYINTKGEEVIPCKYTVHPGRFSDGFACVETPEDGIHFIDKEGKTAITGDFFLTAFMGTASLHTVQTLMPYFRKGICVLQDPNPDTDYKNIAINTSGQRISIPENYLKFAELIENVPVNDNGYVKYEMPDDYDVVYGYKNSNGEVVIPAAYNYLGEFHNGVALAILSYHNSYIENDDPGLPMDGFYIFGYVDEDGNSTFTDADFSHLKSVIEATESKEDDARRKMEREEKERKELEEIKGWIQGIWTCNMYGGRSSILIDGDMIQTSDGYCGYYTIDGDEIRFNRNNGSYNVIYIDRANRRLMASETQPYMRYVENTSKSNANTGIYSGESRHKEFRSESDVWSYMRSHSWKSGKSTVKIYPSEFYVNGSRYQSMAPRIIRFTSTSATIQINLIPSGSLVFQIDPQSGTMYDNAGNYYTAK